MANLITMGLGDTGVPEPVAPDVAPPRVQLVLTNDARKAQVVFTETVVEAEALVAANYSIDPSLPVNAVTKITDATYELSTGRQIPGTEYTVTVSGIHDIHGNLI